MLSPRCIHSTTSRTTLAMASDGEERSQFVAAVVSRCEPAGYLDRKGCGMLLGYLTLRFATPKRDSRLRTLERAPQREISVTLLRIHLFRRTLGVLVYPPYSVLASSLVSLFILLVFLSILVYLR